MSTSIQAARKILVVLAALTMTTMGVGPAFAVNGAGGIRLLNGGGGTGHGGAAAGNNATPNRYADITRIKLLWTVVNANGQQAIYANGQAWYQWTEYWRIDYYANGQFVRYEYKAVTGPCVGMGHQIGSWKVINGSIETGPRHRW